MLLTTPDGVPVNRSTRAVLEDVEMRVERLRGLLPAGANPHALRELEGERDAWQLELDAEIIPRWHRHHALHMHHRKLAAEEAETLRKLAPAYQAAVRRAQQRYDEGGRIERTQRNEQIRRILIRGIVRRATRPTGGRVVAGRTRQLITVHMRGATNVDQG